MSESATASAKAPKKSFFAGVKTEFNKIIWPEKVSVAKQTVAVLLTSVALGVVIKVLDYFIQMGLKLLV